MGLIDTDKLPHYDGTALSAVEVARAVEDAQTIDIESLIIQHEDIGYERGYRDGYAEAWEMLDDAEPVKHGHWIFGETMGHSWMKCSECCVSQSGQTATFTYCPNCGAKMQGDSNEQDI